jgi:hypothetical protein
MHIYYLLEDNQEGSVAHAIAIPVQLRPKLRDVRRHDGSCTTPWDATTMKVAKPFGILINVLRAFVRPAGRVRGNQSD